ncbi:hypothetical protein ENBRE01_1163 [Enteropsectra breve]|nr:hypothetical protein ENBRE01_1163 [Enteropsectra breve]
MIPIVIAMTGFYFWLAGKVSALDVETFTRKFGSEISISISDGEYEYKNNYNGALDYSDIYSSKYLRDCEITARRGDGTATTAEESETLKRQLLSITKVYEAAADACRGSGKDKSEFQATLQHKARESLAGDSDFSALYMLTNITIILPPTVKLKLLEQIIRMRRNLYLRKAYVFKNDFKEFLQLYKLLDFEYGSSMDLFLGDPNNGRTKHVVIEKNTLFAINTALSLYFYDYITLVKERIHSPECLKSGQLALGFNQICEEIETMPFLKSIISVINIKGTGLWGRGPVDILNILLCHGNTPFGYSFLGNGKFFLQPDFAFGDDFYFPASIFSIFDQLGVFRQILELRALCFEGMEPGVGIFYADLISVMPSLRNIEVEEIEVKRKFRPKKIKYEDKDDDDGPETLINSVLHELLIKNKKILKSITGFNIKGYVMLRNDLVEELKRINFRSFGLFGKYRIKDFYYTHALLSGECSLRSSIQEFTGNCETVFLANEVLEDGQLKRAIFNLNDQDNEFPTRIYEKNPELLCKLESYFTHKSFRNTINRTKNYSFSSVSLVHRPRIFFYYNRIERCILDINEIQNKKMYILASCRAKEVSSCASIGGTSIEDHLSVSVVCADGTAATANTDISLKSAIHRLKYGQSKIYFTYALGTPFDQAIPHFIECVTRMIKDFSRMETHLKGNTIDFILVFVNYSYGNTFLEGFLNKKIREAIENYYPFAFNILVQ